MGSLSIPDIFELIRNQNNCLCTGVRLGQSDITNLTNNNPQPVCKMVVWGREANYPGVERYVDLACSKRQPVKQGVMSDLK